MRNQKMCPLSIGHKAKLRAQIISGARNYNKYLVNKVFKIICEDGTEIDVIAMFARQSENPTYHELVYVSNVLGVYEKNQALLEQLDNSIQMKFMEIITRPEI